MKPSLTRSTTIVLNELEFDVEYVYEKGATGAIHSLAEPDDFEQLEIESFTCSKFDLPVDFCDCILESRDQEIIELVLKEAKRK